MIFPILVIWKMTLGVIESSATQSEGGQGAINRWGSLYTIAASIALSTAVGVGIKYFGYSGDLPYIIMRVHRFGYVPIKCTLQMACFILLRIAGRTSVGRNPPLVAISVSITGWLLIHYFKPGMVMMRRCTTMGMSAGLSPLFGVQLGRIAFVVAGSEAARTCSSCIVHHT